MQDLEQLEVLNQLFSLYETLLTQKQATYFKMYYFDDYSLQEIADEFNLSRNAIFDQLKKVQNYLLEYEEKLKLLHNQNIRKEYFLQYDKTKDEKYLNLIRKMDQ